MSSREEDPGESYAGRYDRERVEYGWYGSEVLLGLMYRYIKAGEALLDLGIGTGAGTVLFKQAGLRVSGIDYSRAMLVECEKKNLGFHLVEHDLTDLPWPFEDRSFNHVIATGVFHFIGDLRGILGEVARLLEVGGTFGFDIYEFTAETAGDYQRLSDGIYTSYDAEYRVKLYRHSMEYLRKVIEATGFRLLHDLEFLVSRERKQYFRTILLGLK